MGSAGAKAMAVVLGEADIYAHSGGQYEWDSCAPVAVAAAAGLHVSRIDGSALRYNQPDSYLPDLLICRPELADAVLAALRCAAWLSVRGAGPARSLGGRVQRQPAVDRSTRRRLDVAYRPLSAIRSVARRQVPELCAPRRWPGPPGVPRGRA